MKTISELQKNDLFELNVLFFKEDISKWGYNPAYINKTRKGDALYRVCQVKYNEKYENFRSQD